MKLQKQTWILIVVILVIVALAIALPLALIKDSSPDTPDSSGDNPYEGEPGDIGKEEFKLEDDSAFATDQQLSLVTGFATVGSTSSWQLKNRSITMGTDQTSAANVYTLKSDQDLIVWPVRLNLPLNWSTDDFALAQVLLAFCDVDGNGIGLLISRNKSGVAFSSPSVNKFQMVVPTTSDPSLTYTPWEGGVLNIGLAYNSNTIICNIAGKFTFSPTFITRTPLIKPGKIKSVLLSQTSSQKTNNFTVINCHLFTTTLLKQS